MKKNKKGDLLKDVLSIIIALIGLLILFSAIYKLYQVGVSQEIENARKTLDNVIAKIEALPEEESNTFAVQGFKGADNWYLVGFGKNDERPDKCFFESCICVCKEGGFKENCQDNGICRDFGEKEIDIYTNKFEFQRGEEFGEYFRKCIRLKENLFEIDIEKKLNLINITHTNTDIDLYLDECIVKGDEKKWTVGNRFFGAFLILSKI